MRRLVQILILFTPAAALALAVSADSILQQVAAHREEMELVSLTVRGTFTFEGADARAAAAALQITSAPEVSAPGVVTYKMPGRCKVELVVPGEGPAVSNVRGSVRASGPALASLRLFAARVCPLLARPSGEELVAFVKGCGIDTSRVALGRLNGALAFVIGGRSRSAGVPGFWVEQERLDPLRLISRNGGRIEDVKLLDYSSVLAGEWHPRIVEIRRGRDLTRFAADKIEANTEVSDTFF